MCFSSNKRHRHYGVLGLAVMAGLIFVGPAYAQQIAGGPDDVPTQQPAAAASYGLDITVLACRRQDEVPPDLPHVKPLLKHMACGSLKAQPLAPRQTLILHPGRRTTWSNVAPVGYAQSGFAVGFEGGRFVLAPQQVDGRLSKGVVIDAYLTQVKGDKATLALAVSHYAVEQRGDEMVLRSDAPRGDDGHLPVRLNPYVVPKIRLMTSTTELTFGQPDIVGGDGALVGPAPARQMPDAFPEEARLWAEVRINPLNSHPK